MTSSDDMLYCYLLDIVSHLQPLSHRCPLSFKLMLVSVSDNCLVSGGYLPVGSIIDASHLHYPHWWLQALCCAVHSLWLAISEMLYITAIVIRFQLLSSKMRLNLLTVIRICYHSMYQTLHVIDAVPAVLPRTTSLVLFHQPPLLHSVSPSHHYPYVQRVQSFLINLSWLPYWLHFFSFQF